MPFEIKKAKIPIKVQKGSKRGRGVKGGGEGGGVKDTYRNSKDVRSLKVPSSISNDK